MTSPRDRQAKSRKARREAGLVQFTRWIPADKLDAMSEAYDAICKEAPMTWPDPPKIPEELLKLREETLAEFYRVTGISGITISISDHRDDIEAMADRMVAEWTARQGQNDNTPAP